MSITNLRQDDPFAITSADIEAFESEQRHLRNARIVRIIERLVDLDGYDVEQVRQLVLVLHERARMSVLLEHCTELNDR